MAFNRKYFNLIKYLFPKSNIFELFIQKTLTKFLEGLTALPDDFRTFIDNIFFDLFPDTTRSLELWESQFAIRFISTDDTIRRANISQSWKLKGGQSAKYLQDKLQQAGFDVLVHENNPAVDPDLFLQSAFIATCGNSWAVCGNDQAFCGLTGGHLLVNGYLPASSDMRDYLAVCGGDGITPVFCGSGLAVCGYFEQFFIIPKTYEVPASSDTWAAVFFIGGIATRDPITHKITEIEKINIENSRRNDFENIILKIKPVNTWAGLIVDYIN